MHMTLCLNTGLRTDALLLAATKDRMRLAVRNRNETIELRFERGQWLSEDGSVVEIESMIWDGMATVPDLRGQTVPRARTAGG